MGHRVFETLRSGTRHLSPFSKGIVGGESMGFVCCDWSANALPIRVLGYSRVSFVVSDDYAKDVVDVIGKKGKMEFPIFSFSPITRWMKSCKVLEHATPLHTSMNTHMLMR